MCGFWEAAVAPPGLYSGHSCWVRPGTVTPSLAICQPSHARRAAALGAELQLSPQSIDDTAGFGGAEGMPSPSPLASGRSRATLEARAVPWSRLCASRGVSLLPPAPLPAAVTLKAPCSADKGVTLKIKHCWHSWVGPLQRQRGVEPKPRQQRAERGDALCPAHRASPARALWQRGWQRSAAQVGTAGAVPSLLFHRCCQPRGPGSRGKAKDCQGQVAPTSPREPQQGSALHYEGSCCSTEKLHFHFLAPVSLSGCSVPKRRQWRSEPCMQSPALLTEKQRLTCRLQGLHDFSSSQSTPAPFLSPAAPVP